MGAKVRAVFADLTDYQRQTLAWLNAQPGPVSDADVFLSCVARWADLPDLQAAGQAFEDKDGWHGVAGWFARNYPFVMKLVAKVRRAFQQYEPDEVAAMLLTYLYQFAGTIRPDGGAKMLTYFGSFGYKNVMVDLACESPMIRLPKWAMEKRRGAGITAPVVLSFGESGDSEDVGRGVPEPAAAVPECDGQPVREVWERALKVCSRRQRRVLSLLYRDGKTLADAGAIIGVTRERVRQLHAAAIVRCRDQFTTPEGGWPASTGKGFSGKAEGVGA